MSLQSKTRRTLSMEKVWPEKSRTWNECSKEESNIKEVHNEKNVTWKKWNIKKAALNMCNTRKVQHWKYDKNSAVQYTNK